MNDSRTPHERHIYKIHKDVSRTPKPESLALIEARHLRAIFRLALSGSVCMCVFMCVCVRARLCVRERQRKRDLRPIFRRVLSAREREGERERVRKKQREPVCVYSVFFLVFFLFLGWRIPNLFL